MEMEIWLVFKSNWSELLIPVAFEVLAGELLSILIGFQLDQYQIQPKQAKSNSPNLSLSLPGWRMECKNGPNLTQLTPMTKKIHVKYLSLQTEQGVIKIQTCHRPRSTPVDVKTTRSSTILRGQTVSVTLFTASTSASISRISHIGMSVKIFTLISKEIITRGHIYLILCCYDGLQVMGCMKHAEVIHAHILKPDNWKRDRKSVV